MTVLRSGLGWALTLAALVLGALVLLPAALGLQRYAILTGSMTGTMDAGSLVVSEHVPVGQLRTGDIITFEPPAGSDLPGIVTHRIVRIDRGTDGRPLFTTKGDANPTPDRVPFTSNDPTMARAVFDVPHAGRALLLLDSPRGRLLVFAIPALLIAAGAVARLWAEAGAATRPSEARA